MAVTGYLPLSALGSGPTLVGSFADFGFDAVLPAGVTITKVQLATSWNLSSLPAGVSYNFWAQSDTRGGGGHQYVIPVGGGPNPYLTETVPGLDAITSMTRAAFLNERFFIRSNLPWNLLSSVIAQGTYV